ncbi:MAG: hypothetical protein V4598_12685 [Bdellovibrionota bacterium]
MKSLSWPLTMSLLLLGAACGKAGKPVGTPYQEELKSDGSNISGTYSANLFPVNINLHAPKAGMATFTRKGDELIAKVKLTVGAQGAYYRQAVYWGNRCPGIESDTNKDGYLDMTEIESTLGDVIIPLDGDLDSQSSGTGNYPSGMNARGSYFYKRTASFSRFFEDLKSPDENTRDRVRKLEDQSGFTFLGKVVLVQGASEDFNIPDSVSSYYGLSRVRSLPIACGVFFKSNDSITDEAETTVVVGEEPNDGPATPFPTPTGPDVNTNPNPVPTPTPGPTPQPTPTPEEDEDEDDDNGDVIDDIRDWWDHVTGDDDDDDDRNA